MLSNDFYRINVFPSLRTSTPSVWRPTPHALQFKSFQYCTVLTIASVKLIFFAHYAKIKINVQKSVLLPVAFNSDHSIAITDVQSTFIRNY